MIKNKKLLIIIASLVLLSLGGLLGLKLLQKQKTPETFYQISELEIPGQHEAFFAITTVDDQNAAASLNSGEEIELIVWLGAHPEQKFQGAVVEVSWTSDDLELVGSVVTNPGESGWLVSSVSGGDFDADNNHLLRILHGATGEKSLSIPASTDPNKTGQPVKFAKFKLKAKAGLSNVEDVIKIEEGMLFFNYWSDCDDDNTCTADCVCGVYGFNKNDDGSLNYESPIYDCNCGEDDDGCIVMSDDGDYEATNACNDVNQDMAAGKTEVVLAGTGPTTPPSLPKNCNEECVSRGYVRGYCDSEPVVVDANPLCEDGELNIGQTQEEECYIGDIVGVNKGCCCTNSIISTPTPTPTSTPTSAPTSTPVPGDDNCCEGLDAYPYGVEDGNGDCVYDSSKYICLGHCGDASCDDGTNGTQDYGEDKCTCPDDCGETGPTPTPTPTSEPPGPQSDYNLKISFDGVPAYYDKNMAEGRDGDMNLHFELRQKNVLVTVKRERDGTLIYSAEHVFDYLGEKIWGTVLTLSEGDLENNEKYVFLFKGEQSRQILYCGFDQPVDYVCPRGEGIELDPDVLEPDLDFSNLGEGQQTLYFGDVWTDIDGDGEFGQDGMVDVFDYSLIKDCWARNANILGQGENNGENERILFENLCKCCDGEFDGDVDDGDIDKIFDELGKEPDDNF